VLLLYKQIDYYSNMKSVYTISTLVAFLAATYADDFCSDKTNGYFADPKNCIKYYHCFNNAVEEHITCPNNDGVQQLYDPTHTWCNFPEKVDCGDRPICDENDENCIEPPTTVTEPTKPTKAPFECPEPSGYFADPNNCIKYYHCYEGVVEEHNTCPLDEAGKQEYYDPGHMLCDHQERVDCGDRPICDKNDENCIEPSTTVTDPSKPTPPPFECPQPSGYFADPTNCIKYYHCYEGTVEERITCPIANGKQECFDPVNTWCDWPERVDCGNRPICDENDENCNTPDPTATTKPPGPTTSAKPDRCAVYGPCTMDQDGQGPYKAEGPCEQCFCQCVAAGYYSEVCCEAGLVFNEKIEACDFPANMPDCK